MKKKVLKARIAELESKVSLQEILLEGSSLMFSKAGECLKQKNEEIEALKQQLDKANSELFLQGERIKNYEHQLDMTSKCLAEAEKELAKFQPSLTELMNT